MVIGPRAYEVFSKAGESWAELSVNGKMEVVERGLTAHLMDLRVEMKGLEVIVR